MQSSNRGLNVERIVTAGMLEHLPAPVRRYLTFTGIVGKPLIETAHVKYAGKFRLGIDRPWMPMNADQVYTTNPPGFVWDATFKMWGMPLMRGRDTYKDGHGHLFGKLAGLVTIFDLRGDKLDQGTMLRYLNEMTWFPTAFVGENITWEAVDDHSARVTFSHAGRSVSAEMSFDDEGRVVNFVTRRYREQGGDFTLDTWSTPFTQYGTLGGYNLPVAGQAIWRLAAGDLAYADLQITEIDYNRPIRAF